MYDVIWFHLIYRRPMYDVIKYIWTLDEFKTKFSRLAKQAESELESENPPLFLRFINLLVNDAIFLLDEGLNYMKTIQVSIYIYIYKVVISVCLPKNTRK